MPIKALFIVLVGLTAYSNQHWYLPLDDAYITIGNAQLVLGQAIDGYGQTQPTGATSFLHLMAVAVAGLFLPLPLASLAVATLAAALYAVGVWHLISRITPSPVIRLCSASISLLAGMTWAQLMNGLETGMAMAMIVWFAVYLHEGRTRPLAVLAAAMPFVRPELALLSVCGILAEAFRLRRDGARLVAPALLLMGTVLVLGFVCWHFTGTVLPRTAAAKTAFFAEQPLPLMSKLQSAIWLLLQAPISPVLFGMIFLLWLPYGWVFAIFFAGFFAATVINLPGAIHHNWFRYLYPFLPLGIAGWAWGATLWPALRWHIGAMAVVYTALFPFLGWPTYINGLARTLNQERVAAWAVENLAADSRILLHDAGYFGWKTDFAIVDAVGLKTPSAITIHQRITLPSAGQDRGQAIAQIAAANDATHAIILNDWFWGQIAEGLRSAGWTLDLAYPAATDEYQIFRLTPPK